MYWTKTDEEMIMKWINRKSIKEEYELYAYLNPKIWHMTKTIMYRYFNQNLEANKELLEETRNHVFVQLHTFKGKKGTAYSYISAIIKFYINNKRKLAYSNYVDLDYEVFNLKDILYSTDKNEWEYLEEEQLILNKIYKHIDEKLFQLEEERKQMKYKIHKRIDAWQIVGEKLKEYIKEYGISNWDWMGLSDYIINDNELNKYSVVVAIHYFLGFSPTLGVYRNEIDYLKQEKKWVNRIGLLNNDFTPDISPSNMHGKQKNIYQKHKFILAPF